MLFVVAFVIWCALVWPYNPESEGLDGQSMLVGAVAAVLTAGLFGNFFVKTPVKFLQLGRYLWLLCYMPVLAYYCIRANLQVVYLVLHPDIPIEPGIVKVKTKLRSESGIAALANSITLTPGTLSVDVADDGTLFVHWLLVEAEDEEEATRRIVSRFEPFLKRIFE